ncbi:hypothetical protein [Xanthomonas floridensis]|uniref:Uncharacterized protein n=1 Tax=Xanthomonas floridensis TaxID=1843580 RepID=A0A1A9MF77_9XANT|nr:hypothetical protein [Xanthomonas floridensis]MEA5123669.1 hypothetical protein [Xanthomonas floridensis]MEA5131348.1 hypothetical protein [Xanthomonas floridensis]OAG69183.1 hypothetical protein A7D17_09915 [Xanthomonas floridensis]
MRRLRCFAAALAVAGLIAGCRQETAPAPAPPATASAAAATEPQLSRTARLEAFVRTRYGATAGLATAWSGEADGFKADSQVCAEQPVVVGEQVQQLLAVCHRLSDGGHGNPGLIDFFVLRSDGDSFKVVAEKLSETFGSDGNPGSVEVLRLGSDFYGFIVHSFWMGQGLVLESQDLVVPGPKGVVNAGSLRAHIDNSGALACDDDAREPEQTREQCLADAFDVDFTLDVDSSNAQARTWPLRIHEHGSDCGQTLDTTHVFALDTKRWSYPFPNALQREGCK